MTESNFAKMLRMGAVSSILLLASGAAGAQIVTLDLSGPQTPSDLANLLAGPGVVVSNVTYTGANVAAGSFSGGTGIIGFGSGVILSSGNIASVVGPNSVDNKTTSNGTAGDPDLNTLVGGTTFDAAALEFDIVPNSSTLFIQYVFSSEEYNEFVFQGVNDVFGFFVNGTNCALVNGQPVSVDTINNGNPFGTLPNANPTFYINNDLSDGGGALNTEMDGLTTVLTCQAPVNSGVTNHIKLVIADTNDSILDSNVFLMNGGVTTVPPQVIPTLDSLGLLVLISGLAAASLLVLRSRRA